MAVPMFHTRKNKIYIVISVADPEVIQGGGEFSKIKLPFFFLFDLYLRLIICIFSPIQLNKFEINKPNK